MAAAAQGVRLEAGAQDRTAIEEVVVAKGHTVLHNGQHRGPGSKIEVSPIDAEHLRRAGFLFAPEPEAAVDGPTVDGEDGSVVKPK